MKSGQNNTNYSMLVQEDLFGHGELRLGVHHQDEGMCIVLFAIVLLNLWEFQA